MKKPQIVKEIMDDWVGRAFCRQPCYAQSMMHDFRTKCRRILIRQRREPNRENESASNTQHSFLILNSSLLTHRLVELFP